MIVSAHFTADEFDSHDGTDYPPEWIEGRLVPLARVLERVREALGGAPCRVISGYRSPEHNATLRARSSGVAKASQHVEGRAADVTFKGHTPAQVHAVVLALYRDGVLPDLGGLGVYPKWVHLDVRPLGAIVRLAQWTGAGFGAEPVA